MEKLLSALGPVTAVVGAQWGDEGKGKVVDMLAEHFDIIARAGGGANAGHTIVVKGKKHVFHLLPSGCLHEGKPVILGSGMAIHLPTLLEEIEILEKAGIDIIPRLHISEEAHVVFDFHQAIDGVMEELRATTSGNAIGTTKRGIGPAYSDKAMRSGIRMGMLKGDIGDKFAASAALATRAYGVIVDIDHEKSVVKNAVKLIGKRIVNTVDMLQSSLENGDSILIEGAQAVLLDLDHGTYPYVTSSSTTAAGMLHYLGLPPMSLTGCIGVAKAYCTRVGSGEFPTEAVEPAASRLRERGGEYGATTGRPRRTGWLDLGGLKRVARMNGITHWNITKLDVLDEESVIPVGETLKGTLEFEEFPGWNTSTVGKTTFDELPSQAQAYIGMIEERTGIPAALIGTGPDRNDTIVRA